MPWGLGSSPSAPTGSSNDDDKKTAGNRIKTATQDGARSLKDGVVGHFSKAGNWISPAVAVGSTLGLWVLWQRYLRRIPGTAHIPPEYLHRRSLFGKVTSVGDGDGFHFYHTPGGRLAGWGWLRGVPKTRKELKGNTIPIRIAGVDAPEGAHFGKQAQPGATEALEFLDNYLLNRRVRVYPYRRDQYDRIVASAHVRKPPFFFPRKDVGLEMLKRGMAITYEAKFGAEFGGPKQEAKYRAAEVVARRKGKGMWALEKPAGGFLFFKSHKPPPEPLETPMAYKKRMKALDEQQKVLDANAVKKGVEAAGKGGDAARAANGADRKPGVEKKK
ncbi:putative endonuclease LCL3 [Cladorrhinum samala]|uniref:Probable endonuclease LCL3 n=1 Tax=Cladorrhinum samala TaxID=585594 RepID=A0AAV9HEX1_9PEZI|nr:putative endonuclease LCL3 [Cladorrhinum samala]